MIKKKRVLTKLAQKMVEEFIKRMDTHIGKEGKYNRFCGCIHCRYIDWLALN